MKPETALDKFVEFNYLLLNTSQSAQTPAEPGLLNERVDVIARQFRDYLKKRPVADTQPQGMMMTHDFKVRGQTTQAAGWLSFHVDRGNGNSEDFEEVAVVAFVREEDDEVRRVLERVAAGQAIPPIPFAVGVLLKANVPSIVSEFLTKAAAGFFAVDD